MLAGPADNSTRAEKRKVRALQIPVTVNVYTRVPSPETRKAPDRLRATVRESLTRSFRKVTEVVQVHTL